MRKDRGRDAVHVPPGGARERTATADCQLTKEPAAKAAMLVRRPVEEVFEAFVDPEVTARFWFTKGSGRLEQGKQVQWVWEMHNFSILVNVITLEQDKRIIIEWPSPGGSTMVEWLFAPLAANATFVSVSNTGFKGDADEIIRQVIDSTEGFALVLAGLKALLEHNIELHLVADRFPKGLDKR